MTIKQKKTIIKLRERIEMLTRAIKRTGNVKMSNELFFRLTENLKK